MEQVDDFAGRVKAKRVEVAPRHHDVLFSREGLTMAGCRMGGGRQSGDEMRKLYEVGGRRFRVALLPTETAASRVPIGNCGGFRPKCQRN